MADLSYYQKTYENLLITNGFDFTINRYVEVESNIDEDAGMLIDTPTIESEEVANIKGFLSLGKGDFIVINTGVITNNGTKKLYCAMGDDVVEGDFFTYDSITYKIKSAENIHIYKDCVIEEITKSIEMIS